MTVNRRTLDLAAPARPRAATAGPAAARSAQVPAVARAARLLDTLAATRQALPLAALVKALALPKSTVHGLCATLAQAGLVQRLDDGSYQLGTRVMDLAHAYMARTDLTAEFQALLQAEAPMPEESIVLSVLDGADIVYVGCRNGTRPFGFNFRIGMRLPANCAASGKAMLASLPAETVTELALARAFYPLTRKSVTRAAPLLAQLRQVAEQGYAVDDEETRQGMVCIGAPVFSAGTTAAVAAVAVSCPKTTLNAQRKALAIRTVKQLAGDISWRLGARPPA
ncbi:MAG: IclR family transcriptional regulator [Burkholderiales bacterium]|nr:IclR family transcriptional regulator [Burkholderiales bacterium]